MTSVGGVGRTATVAVPGARMTGVPGFRMPEQAASAPAPALPVSIVSLLAVQEAGQGAVRDREARRHSQGMLDALSALQRALLGEETGESLRTLDRMVRGAPAPADPALAAIQRMVLQRTAVELARRKGAARA